MPGPSGYHDGDTAAAGGKFQPASLSLPAWSAACRRLTGDLGPRRAADRLTRVTWRRRGAPLREVGQTVCPAGAARPADADQWRWPDRSKLRSRAAPAVRRRTERGVTSRPPGSSGRLRGAHLQTGESRESADRPRTYPQPGLSCRALLCAHIGHKSFDVFWGFIQGSLLFPPTALNVEKSI